MANTEKCKFPFISVFAASSARFIIITYEYSSQFQKEFAKSFKLCEQPLSDQPKGSFTWWWTPRQLRHLSILNVQQTLFVPCSAPWRNCKTSLICSEPFLRTRRSKCFLNAGQTLPIQQDSKVNPRQIDNPHIFSLNISSIFELNKDCISEIQMSTSTTHPNTYPNTVTYVACIIESHCTVSDAKTDEQRSHNDVHDGKNPRHGGDPACIIRHVWKRKSIPQWRENVIY